MAGDRKAARRVGKAAPTLAAVSIRTSPRLEAHPALRARPHDGRGAGALRARSRGQAGVQREPLPAASRGRRGHRAPALPGLNRYPDGPARAPAARAGRAARRGPGRGRGGQRLVRADPARRAGAARPGHDRRARRPLLRALPAPGRRRGRRGRGRAAGRRRRPRPRRHGGGGRRAHAPRHRVQPQQPDGRLPRRRRDRAFLDALPEDLAMLVDEAYFDFVDRPDAGRTMSLARVAPQPPRHAHVQQGARPVRPARGLRRGRPPGGSRPSTRCASPSTPTPSRRRRRWRACATRPSSIAACGRWSPSARAWSGRCAESDGALPPAGPTLSWCGRTPIRSPVIRCPRAAPAPRRHRARRRRARVSRAPAGLHRDPGGERRHSCRRVRSVARPAPRESRPGRTTAMMIVMQEGATEEQMRHVVERIEQAGARAHPSRGEFVTVIGAIGDDRADRRLAPARGRARGREGRPDPEAVQAGLERLPRQRRRRWRSPGARSAAASSASSPGPAPSSRASRRWPRPAPARRPARPSCAAAPTSRAPRPTPSRASASRASRSWPRRARRPACRS